MPNFLRVILLIIFWIVIIAAFCLAAIILVFMASGYRYNSKSGKVQKTGMIYLKSDPRSANVYVNNELKSLKTPTRLLYLPQDTYHVKISEDSYVDWEKDITVKSEEVSSFDRIVLFLKDKESRELQKNVTSYKLAPNKRSLVYIPQNKNQLFLLNLNSNKITGLYNSKNQFKILSWSSNSAKVLIKDSKSGYIVVNARNQGKADLLSQRIGIKFSKVIWNPVNANYLLGLSQEKIYKIDLVKNTVRMLRSNVSLFETSNYEIFYVNKKDNIERLVKINLDGDNQEFLTPPLTFSVKNISISEKGRISVIDQNNNLYIYIKNNGDYKLEKTKENVLSATWGKPDGIIENIFGDEKLVYYGINEIGGYFQKRDPRFKDEDDYLVTRISETIQKIVWYDDFEHIIYLANNKIHVIELDGSNNIILADNVKNFDVTENGNQLIVLKNNSIATIQIRK